MSDGWLKCEIGDGMFSDEKAITYGDLSVFVPIEKVKDSAVKVQTFEDMGKLFAVIPSSDRAIVPVKQADIRRRA